MSSPVSDTHYCEHCEASFKADDASKPRCPTCLRSGGVTALDPASGPARRISTATVVGVVAIGLAVGGLLWFAAQNMGSDAVDPPAAGTSVAEPPSAPTATPAPPTSLEVGEGVSPKVAELAKALTQGAPTPSAQMRQLMAGLNLRLTAGQPYQPLHRDVYTPEAMAERVLGWKAGEPVELTRVEAGVLTHALVEALGVDAKPVLVHPPQAGATSFRHRDLAVAIDVPGFSGVYAPWKRTEPIRDAPKPAPDEALTAHVRALEAIRLAEQLRFEEAADKIGLAQAASPDDPAFRFLRGQLTVVRGQAEAGLEEMQAAVTQADDAEGRYQLAVALLRDGRTFKAFQALRDATKLDPKHAEAWNALAQLNLDRLSSTPEGQRAAIEAELDAIEKAMGEISRTAPGLIELRVQRLVLKGDLNKARELGVEALNLEPERAPLHVLMAELAQRSGDTAKAQRHLERAAEHDADNAEPLLRLAALHAEAGDAQKALEALQEAARRAPHDPELLTQLSTTLHQQGQPAEALKVAEDIKARFPHLPDGYALLAQLALGADDIPKAVGLAEAALERDSRDPELHVMLYFMHMAAEQPDKAEAVLKKLLAFDPDGRIRIAQELMPNGQIEAAVAILEEELKDQPQRLEVALTLGQLYRLGGQQGEVERLRKHIQAQAGEDAAEALKLYDQAIEEIDRQAQQPPEGGAAQP